MRTQERTSARGWPAGSLIAVVLVLAAGCSPAGGDAVPGAAPGPAWAYEREFTGGPVSLVLRIDKLSATLADQIVLEEELRAEPGFEAELPEYLPEDFDGFSVVEISRAGQPQGAAPEATGEAAAASPPLLRKTKRLVLEPEKSGELAVLPLAVYFRREGEAKESSFLTEEVKIEVKGIEDIGALALRGPRGIYEAPPAEGGGAVLPWAAGGAAAMLAAAAVAWRVARRPRIAPPPAPPHEIAYESLRRLVALDLIEKGDVERFFVLLSAILREYIENRFRVHAPERTTEEFLAEASANRALEGHRARLGEFLALSDEVKFARFRPEAADIQSAFDVVKRFVAETIIDHLPMVSSTEARP